MNPNEHLDPAAADDGHHSGLPHLPDPSIFPLILTIGMATFPVGMLLGVFPWMRGNEGVGVGLAIFFVGLLIFAIGLGGWLYEDTRTHLKARNEQH